MSPTVTTCKNILVQSSVKPSQMALVYYEFISETPWGCKSLIEAKQGIYTSYMNKEDKSIKKTELKTTSLIAKHAFYLFDTGIPIT